MASFPCPCCGYLVFSGPPGTYEICPICGWEDDVSQLRFPTVAGGANEPSLVFAQKSFLKFGWKEKGVVPKVRDSILKDQIKDPTWRPLEIADLPAGGDDYIEGREPYYPANRTELYYWKENYWRRK